MFSDFPYIYSRPRLPPNPKSAKNFAIPECRPSIPCCPRPGNLGEHSSQPIDLVNLTGCYPYSLAHLITCGVF